MAEANIFISKATKRNWDKLKSSGADRLTRRANKSRSRKTIVPDGYVMAGSLPRFVEDLRNTTYPIDALGVENMEVRSVRMEAPKSHPGHNDVHARNCRNVRIYK